MSEINFRSSAKQGDISEIKWMSNDWIYFFNFKIKTKNTITRKTMITILNTAMVNLCGDGKPKTNGKKEVEFTKDRLVAI